MKIDGVTFSKEWKVLGPFQIGTREATWGADPLESLGGFHFLQCDENAKYRSSIAPGGYVVWTRSVGNPLDAVVRSAHGVAATEIVIDFPDIDWRALQSVYGWSILQWQGWTRGFLKINNDVSQAISLNIENVLEFWLGEEHYFGGDYYAYQRGPLCLSLSPGSHQLDIRLVRDVRSMGGAVPPTLPIRVVAEIVREDLVIDFKSCKFPDTVNGQLAGPYAAITATNTSRKAIYILGIEWIDHDDKDNLIDGYLGAKMYQNSPASLISGQSRPLIVHLCFSGSRLARFRLGISYRLENSNESNKVLKLDCQLREKDLHMPHKVTYLHPSETVSYAILRPPSTKACSTCPSKRSTPVLIGLHGAGVDVDNQIMRNCLDPLPDLPAWVLFPSGATSWSGDDWHEWGFSDIEAAVSSITNWIKSNQWKGPTADLDKWLVVGHSNGGQGTWFALTHRPDKIIGAAPISGYSSIQAYVSYHMWNEADPRISYCMQNTLRSYRHETLISNFDGIPIVQQHGSADNNVPVFHSRRLHQLVSQTTQTQSDAYVELEGKGHWFDGVMTTTPLQEFYRQVLESPTIPNLPLQFSIVVANPSDMASRGGIRVDLLSDPGQLGRIDVEREPTTATWKLKTSNICRFRLLAERISSNPPLKLVIDSHSRVYLPRDRHSARAICQGSDGCWSTYYDGEESDGERQRSQLGPLSSILRSSGHFIICLRSVSWECSLVASQISRNLFRYFFADTEVITGATDLSVYRGNVISVYMGRCSGMADQERYPIRVIGGHITIARHDGKQSSYELEEGLGAIFLSPLPNGRLGLIIWGVDDRGLRQAARLFPMLSGVGQPEFIVVRRQCAWNGAAGVLAMGSFTNFWKASESSFMM